MRKTSLIAVRALASSIPSNVATLLMLKKKFGRLKTEMMLNALFIASLFYA